MKVVAIGAHPDDIEYGCCGTILKHVARGDKVFFIVMSHGERGGEKGFRKKEAEESARMLGVELIMFDFPDTSIPQSHDVIEKIEEVVKKVMPDRIYTHSIKDTHQDHRNVAYNALVGGRTVPEIFCFESPSLYLDFKPNYYIDVSDFISQKTKILNKFRTQNGKDFMKLNAIHGLAQFRGLASTVKYSEAFEVIKIIKLGKNV